MPELDEFGFALAELTDPGLLSACQLSSTLHRVQQPRNQRDAYIDHLAAAAADAGTSKDLHAGSSGMFVGIATNQDPATGAASAPRAVAAAVTRDQ